MLETCDGRLSRTVLRGEGGRKVSDLPGATKKDNEMTRIKTKSLGLLFSVLVVLFGSSSAHAKTAQEIAKKAFHSVVLLVMEDANGQPLSLGSGFFVHDGQIASNLHVVEGASRGYAKLVGQKTKYDIEGITAVDSERDLVVLKISASGSPALSLGSSDAVQVGENVYAVGNPQGLEGTFSQGIVSSIRKVGSDKILQITAPISPGSSGGPVLNAKGEVIGVSVATFRGGQNLNFAIPSNYLKNLLGKAGTAKPLAQAMPTKTQRSILSDLGGKSSEGVLGTQFVWQSFVDYELTFPYNGEYSLSLKNQLREPVRNVYMLVVFYDSLDSPLDVNVVRYSGLIPAGLAKRISGQTDGSVQKLTTPRRSATPSTRVEFRVLDFEIVNGRIPIPENVYFQSVRARHILVVIPWDTSNKIRDEKFAKAQRIRQSLLDGEDFAEIARRESDDPSASSNGGDLGFFSRGRMVKAFEDAAFQQTVGQIGPIVETVFGFHIIQVLDRR